MSHNPIFSRRFLALAAMASLMTVVVGCSTPAAPDAPVPGSQPMPPTRSPAVAAFITPAGQPGGQAALADTPAGLEIVMSVQGLKPGQHAFHVHAAGACAPGPDSTTGRIVDFGAAGGHFDPGLSRNHGRPGQPSHEAHAGELPNITVGADGSGKLRYVNANLTLAPGKTSALGRTLIVHEDADDYATDPAGNSGGRVLCGLIEPAQPGPVIARATIDNANAYPEGIAVDVRDGSAYVGSASEGHIWRIAPGAGKAELFQIGGALGRQGAFGMKVDSSGRLWVAGGPQGSVAIVDLASAATIANLKSPPGSHTFLNDLVIAGDGHVYVTDSFRPILFRTRSKLGASATLEPWLDLTTTPIRYVPNQINLNGIVASPDGLWLLTIQLSTGQLWRIDTATKAVSEVRVDGGALTHGDGLLLRGTGELFVVRTEDQELVRLQLAEGWGSARVVQRIADPKLMYPTTAAATARGIMVVNAQLDKQKDPPPMLPFDVVTIGWPAR